MHDFGMLRKVLDSSPVAALKGKTDEPEIVFDEEGRRAGYLAMALLFFAASVIGIRIAFVPSVVFLCGSALCLLRLSDQKSDNCRRVVRILIRLFGRFYCLPVVLRLRIIVGLILTMIALSVTLPRSIGLYEFMADVIVSSALILFMIPPSLPPVTEP